jgi:hypothetical protein
MTTEYLPEKVELPLIEPGPIEERRLYDYFRLLIGEIERYIINTSREVNNLILTSGTTNVITFALPDDNGVYADGIWRITTSTAGYSIQQKQSGSFVTMASMDTAGKLTVTDATVSGVADGLATLVSGVVGSTADNTTNWDLSYAHSVGDGSDHTDVALNTIHAIGDGSDHADVATNTAHAASDGSGHSDVALNSTHRTSNGTDHGYVDQDVQTTASPEFAGLTIADAGNVVLGTTTGTEIGTAATQKLGFYGTTPAVQPTAVADATGTGDVVAQLNALLARARTLGLIAT